MEKDKKENYQVDTGQVAKQVVKGVVIYKTAKLIAGIIIVIPILIIFVLFFFLGIKTRAFFNWSANTRGIIVFAVIALPVLAGSILYPKIRSYLEEKMHK